MGSTAIICHAVLRGSSYNEDCNITILSSTFPKRPFLMVTTARTTFFEQNTWHDEVGGAQDTLQEPLGIVPYLRFIKSEIFRDYIVSIGKATDASVERTASISTVH